MRKKIIIFAIFLIFGAKGFCETSVKIPDDYLSEILKKAESATDMNFLERLMIDKTVKNAEVNGVKLKDYNVKSLMNYINDDKYFKEISPNSLIEPKTGATLQFESDGKCDSKNCKIIVDMNGENPPNEIWTDPFNPKDRIILIIKQDDKGGAEIVFPEFSKDLNFNGEIPAGLMEMF